MRVLSVASAIPVAAIRNDTVEERLALEKGWIERRTGIRQRPVAAPGEATSDLAVRAADEALRRAGVNRAQIGLVILATSTPDHLLPPSAPLVAHRLRLTSPGAIDLAGACSGFLYGLTLAAAYGQSARTATLVIGANILTRRVDERDAGTAALFSDGAGAVVLEPTEPSNLLASHLGSDGSMYDAIGVPAGGSREPLTAESLAAGRHLMTMRHGAALFKSAVRAMADAGLAAMSKARMNPADIAWWVPHQANARIIRETGSLLEIPPERTINIVSHVGNSSAATIPIALAYAADSGRLERGQNILMTAAGAGMLNAGVVVRW